MKALLSIFIVITMFFTSCSSTFAFGKSKAKKTTSTSVEAVSDGIFDNTNISSKKIKKTKQKTEKVKTEKVKKEKVKKTKKTKSKDTASLQEQTSSGVVADSITVATKNKKTKKEKKVKQKQAKTETTPQTTAEKGNKKRSFLGRFLNPNLDIYEVRASHILVKKRKDAVNIRKDILNGDITFEEAAQRYSLCPTGPYGGDLGYFNRRKMDQLFADAAFDLKIGEISDPVGTKFGWHLIKVVDKR